MREDLISAPIQQRVRFSEVRYANCWEDAAVVARALEPLAGARCLSIASGGDNSFSILARDAASVLAVDVSPAQLALVALKAAAFESLGHEELLGFLGVRPCASRLRTYRDLRASLAREARVFWDERLAAIEQGVVHCGRLEAYFQTFRRRVLPLVHGHSTVATLLAPRDEAGRLRFYEETWDGWRWRALFRLFFSRRVMGWLGRDPELFRYVHGPVAERILERARHGLAVLPTHDNPYLHYILTGSFGKALPDYLRPENHAPIRQRLDRLSLRMGAADEVAAQLPDRSIDAFNLSDIAEYADLPAYHCLLEGLRRIAAPGARLAYWNLLAPRRRPQSMARWLEAAGEKAARLHAEAQAFFYQALVLEVAR